MATGHAATIGQNLIFAKRFSSLRSQTGWARSDDPRWADDEERRGSVKTSRRNHGARRAEASSRLGSRRPVRSVPLHGSGRTWRFGTGRPSSRSCKSDQPRQVGAGGIHGASQRVVGGLLLRSAGSEAEHHRVPRVQLSGGVAAGGAAKPLRHAVVRAVLPHRLRKLLDRKTGELQQAPVQRARIDIRTFRARQDGAALVDHPGKMHVSLQHGSHTARKPCAKIHAPYSNR